MNPAAVTAPTLITRPNTMNDERSSMNEGRTKSMEGLMSGLALKDAVSASLLLQAPENDSSSSSNDGDDGKRAGGDVSSSAAKSTVKMLHDPTDKETTTTTTTHDRDPSRRRRRRRRSTDHGQEQEQQEEEQPTQQDEVSNFSLKEHPLRLMQQQPMGKASSLSAMRTVSSSLSPPPSQRRDNSLNSLLREGRPHLGRCASETAAATRRHNNNKSSKGVRFAADANGELINTIHEIPSYLPKSTAPLLASPSNRKSRKGGGLNYNNHSYSSASPTSHAVPWRNSNTSSSNIVHATRPAFAQDGPPSRSRRRENRFRADSGRDSAPVILPRRAARQESVGEQQQEQQETQNDDNNNNAAQPPQEQQQP